MHLSRARAHTESVITLTHTHTHAGCCSWHVQPLQLWRLQKASAATLSLSCSLLSFLPRRVFAKLRRCTIKVRQLIALCDYYAQQEAAGGDERWVRACERPVPSSPRQTPRRFLTRPPPEIVFSAWRPSSLIAGKSGEWYTHTKVSWTLPCKKNARNQNKMLFVLVGQEIHSWKIILAVKIAHSHVVNLKNNLQKVLLILRPSDLI